MNSMEIPKITEWKSRKLPNGNPENYRMGLKIPQIILLYDSGSIPQEGGELHRLWRL